MVLDCVLGVDILDGYTKSIEMLLLVNSNNFSILQAVDWVFGLFYFLWKIFWRKKLVMDYFIICIYLSTINVRNNSYLYILIRNTFQINFLIM